MSSTASSCVSIFDLRYAHTTTGFGTSLTHNIEVSASNAITFSSYILVASGADSTTWKLRGVAIAGAVFSVGIHTVAPRTGRAIQDLLSAVKLFTLLFIVCCGFAALSGHLRVESPHNFTNAFEGTSNSGYNIGSAILNVIFSFQGYDNVNAVSFIRFLGPEPVFVLYSPDMPRSYLKSVIRRRLCGSRFLSP